MYAKREKQERENWEGYWATSLHAKVEKREDPPNPNREEED
jgi:hypothetical protein